MVQSAHWQALTGQLGRSLLSRLLYNPLRCLHPFNVQTLTSPAQRQQIHRGYQCTLVLVLHHSLRPRVQPFLYHLSMYRTASSHTVAEHPQTTKGVNGFGDETNALIGADLLISITDFIGEVILIYRCWLLWSRNYWIIILPSLTAIATLGKSWWQWS